MAVRTVLRLVAVAAHFAYHYLFLMGRQPVLGMLLTVAGGAQVILYLRGMLYLGMTVIACYLIVRNMFLMHETEVFVFIDPFPDIVAGIAFVLWNDIVCTYRYVRMACHAVITLCDVARMVKVRIVVMRLFWRTMAGRTA